MYPFLPKQPVCIKDITPNLQSCELLQEIKGSFRCKADVFISLDSSECERDWAVKPTPSLDDEAYFFKAQHFKICALFFKFNTGVALDAKCSTFHFPFHLIFGFMKKGKIKYALQVMYECTYLIKLFINKWIILQPLGEITEYKAFYPPHINLIKPKPLLFLSSGDVKENLYRDNESLNMSKK